MKLPNAEQGIVAQPALTEYLLSPTRPSGRSKAAFFARLGFASMAWEALADALRRYARESGVVAIDPTPFGTSYVVDGTLAAPCGPSKPAKRSPGW